MLALREVSRTEFPEFVFNQLLLSGTIFLAFVIKNKNKQFLLASAISISLIPLCQLLDFLPWKNFNLVFVGTIFTSILAASFYFLRFWNKSNKWSILELLKTLAVLQFVIAHSIGALEYGRLSTLILGFIFLSTKSSQYEILSTMKRNLITGILTLICVFFIVLANIKASEAEKQTILANMNYTDAREQKESMNLRINELELKLDSIQKQLIKCQIGK
ncbi:MAG: hypothetical protein R8N23_16190 [Reichenbachiella sp.]|uniref:hypothetical protein n=1 Tax=Reichenbachiella sp. TaxID=2184521 RepID=UPI0029665031|nr:hypothetical protein [Reichenbachiella sp.]MDW3211411.1 hypothetical protein [Reichenbachiella sp.]